MSNNINASFIDAVTAYQIQKPSFISFLGRKAYLSFDSKTGWKVHQLTIFGQFFRKLGWAYRNTHKKFVLQKLETLTLTADEGKILQKSDFYAKMNQLKEVLKKIFEKALSTEVPPPPARPPIDPPRNVRTQPIDDPTSKVRSPRPRVIDPVPLRESEKPAENKDIPPKDSESRAEKDPRTPPLATTPLFLSNYGNSCYLDSTMEILLSQDFIRKQIFAKYLQMSKDHSELIQNYTRICEVEIPQIFNDCETQKGSQKEAALKASIRELQNQADDLQKQASRLEKKLNIVKELRNLIIEADKTGKGDQKTLGYGSAAEKVRQAIFASGLNDDLKGAAKIGKQHDAAAAFLVINEILNNEIRTVTTSTGFDPQDRKNLASIERTSILHKMELCIEEDVPLNINRAIYGSIKGLLKKQLLTKNYSKEKEALEGISAEIQKLMASIESLDGSNSLKSMIKNCHDDVKSQLKKLDSQRNSRDRFIQRLLPLLSRMENPSIDCHQLIKQFEYMKKNPEKNLKEKHLRKIALKLEELQDSLNLTRKDKRHNLTDMVEKYFTAEKAATRTGESQTQKFTLKNDDKVDLPYINQAKLLELPESFALHVNLYDYNEAKEKSEKLHDSISLPKDGIVDMTPYFSVKKGEAYQYEITGYVIQHGDTGGGHYTSNVKIGDKFYHCDDSGSSPFEEISPQQFYGYEHAYLIMFKKIPHESGQSK